LLHHALHLPELRKEIVDLHHRRARASGNAPLATGIDHAWVVALAGRHRVDDGLDHLHLLIGDVGRHVCSQLRHARNHVQQLADRSHLFELLELISKILQVKLTLDQLLAHLEGLLLVHDVLSLFDGRKDVPQAQDAARQAIGMKDLQGVSLFAHAQVLDRYAGHRAHRDGRTTSGITVNLGQDQAGDPHPLVKLVGDAHGILTGHGIHDQEHFLGVSLGLDLLELVHQLVVDVQAAGGVEQHHAVRRLAGPLDCVGTDLGRRNLVTFAVDWHVKLPAQHLELGDGRRPASISRYHQGPLPALAQRHRQLGCGRRLARSLEANQHDHVR